MAQHTADIGVQLAAATYWGDIQKVNYAKSITPVVGILGRWNFNKRLAIRGQLLTGNIKAIGLTSKDILVGQPGTGTGGANTGPFPIDPNSNFNFSRAFQTVEGLIEFNFRNYKLGNTKKQSFTPFVAIGLGAFYSRAPRIGSFILDPNETSPGVFPSFPNPVGQPVNPKMTSGFDVLTLTIPVGVGFKFNITKRLGGLVDLVVRKTFSDNLDNLNDPKRFENPIGTTPNLTYAGATKGLNNNDWFATLAVSLTWQLWSEAGNCPLYDKIKKKR